jgi:CBS domain containing-hemolysin-like protein
MPFGFILLALALVGANAFFVAAEFAIVRVRATRIEELIASGAKRAAATKKVIEDLNAYLSACQLGITLTSLGLGWVGEPAFATIFESVLTRVGVMSPVAVHSAAIAVSFGIITLLHVVLGELVPKWIAIERSDAVALWVSWPLLLFHRTFYPLTWILNGLSILVVKAMGLAPLPEEQSGHSEEELRMILGLSRKSGVLSSAHAELLENALDFVDRTVRQIMVPRGDIVSLDVNRPYEENLAAARRGGHTRYPLCDGDLDRVVGVVHIKDLFLLATAGSSPPDLRTISREPLFVPESLGAQALLTLIQKQRVHLGIVVDEYGGTSGIVTLEDVLEELIGEIQDEFDEEMPKIHALEDGRLSVDASLPVNELPDALGIPDEEHEGVDTLGGLVLLSLGRMARIGDVVEIGGRRVEVARLRGRRIMRVNVDPPRATPRTADAETTAGP